MGQENFRDMRKAMVVSQLRTTDVSDPRVIAAMADVPREDFVPAAKRSLAYTDRGVQLGDGRALNPPLATGLLLNAAEITRDDQLLLIGAATGYSAAVAAQLAGSVTAVEKSAKLVTKAKDNLADLDNVRIEKADLNAGYAAGGPYSVILIDGLVEHVPAALVDQLSDDGRLVGAILDNGVARLAVGRKAGNVIGYQYFADCSAATLPGFEQPKGFEF